MSISLLDKQKIKEIDNKILELQKEKEKINPFINLKSLSNKKFGEDFAENYVFDRVPNLKKSHGAGHDAYSEKKGFVEIKSFRLPLKSGWTANQMHLNQTDNFLFVFFDTENYETKMYFIPSNEISLYFKITRQHGEGCYSMGETTQNKTTLEKYQIENWEKLNQIL